MEEQAKTNPQQQASMRQINSYTVYGDETDRLKRFPKATPPPPPVKCEFCGKTLYAYGFTLGESIHWMVGHEACNCQKAIEKAEREEAERQAEERRKQEEERNRQIQAQVNRIVGASGIGARFRLRTFETFELTEENKKAAFLCQKYADTFKEKLPTNGKNPGRNGLFITGPKGTGKTHLVAAIANKLMNQRIPVICMTMIDLLERIKSTYTDARQRFGSYYDAADVLDAYTAVSLLIIDDLGKEQATEWAIAKIYAIINARYEALMPTIITTNYSEAELIKRLTPKETGDPTTADAAIDRLREMCGVIVTTGESWRTK